ESSTRSSKWCRDDSGAAPGLIARHSGERRRFARPTHRMQTRDFEIFDRFRLMRMLDVAKAAYCKYPREESLPLSVDRLNRRYKSHMPYCRRSLPYEGSAPGNKILVPSLHQHAPLVFREAKFSPVKIAA